MKLFLLLFTGFLFSGEAFSQVGEETFGRENGQGRQNGGRLYGKIVDGKTNRGIEAASVQLFKKSDHSLAGGMLSKPNGDFDIPNISTRDTFLLEISAIGFSSQEIPVFFEENISEKDLGNIKLTADARLLNTVTVVGQRPALQMGIDRKAFDVSKSIVSTGGTGIDVMRNIPSVTVDVDGNVLLRNSPPQIFVDGRPTILTLDQIPADHIERVELITNPSAKFDAASVGGIINIILKKDKKLGLNGQVSVGAGSPDILNSNLTLNLREGQFNFFVSGNYNQRGGLTNGETYRQNKDDGIITDYFNQFSQNERLRRFGSARFGIDYYIDNRSTLTLTQNFVKGRNTSNEKQDQQFLDINNVLDHTGLRTSDSRFGFDRSNTQLIYRRTFVEPGKTFGADISYNTGKGNDNTDIANAFFNPDGSIYSPTNKVRNNGANKNNQVTIQVDFVDPKGEDSKLETGIRSYINDFTSEFNSFSVVNGGSEVKLPLSNHYKYLEMVNAAYLTYTGKLGGIRYQAGLRAEHSKFDGELVDSAFKFGYQYPANLDNIFDALFPSLFLTKEIGEGQEVQLNYSRRIRRPDFWNLNPFVDINDPFNIRQGNPALKPEFTNNFEFNYNINYNTGNFLGVLYYNNTSGEITRYSDTITAAQYQQLNNAAVSPDAILNTFINADSENRIGAELTLQQKITDNFDITPTIDMQYTRISVKNDKLNLSNEGFTFETKLILNYRVNSRSPIFNNLSFQVMGEYESPEVEPQGKNKEQYVVDAGLRKDFLKNKRATLTFNINDVFNTRRFGSIFDTENFYQDSYRRWNVRSFRVTLSYRFGSSEFSLFKRNNNNRNNRQDEDNNGGEGQERN